MASTTQPYLSGQITCTVSADLMPNYIAGSAIDARFQIDVAQDANGDPILFSISSPTTTDTATTAAAAATDASLAVNQFFATMRDPAIPTGWQQVNISPRTDRAVQAFGVVQDAKANTIVLAVALDDGAGGSEVYLTGALSADTTKTDWNTLAATAWHLRPGIPAGAVVTKLVLGSNTAISKVPLVIASVESAGAALNFFLQGDPTKNDCHNFDAASTSCWWPYQLPEGATSLQDLVIGTMYLDQAYRLGTYTLYQVGSAEHLMFTSVPDAYYLPHFRQLTPPAGAKLLQTLPDPDPAWNGCSTLYVGGTGLSIFEASAQSTDNATGQVISADAAFADVTQLLARADSTHVSLWVKTHNQVLYYLRGDQHSTARNWTVPLSLRQNVARIAALRNQPRAANEVFAVGSDNTVAYIWQDAATTQWKENDLPLPALETVQEFPCFTTVLTFLDANLNPATNQTVSITASEWMYATVNGYFKALDPTDAIDAVTDSLGKVTIINKVGRMATPIFSVTAECLAAPVTANPAANVLAGLAKLQTGQDLLDAQTLDGQPVITGDLRNDSDQLDAVASSIQQLLPMLDELPADGSPYTTPPATTASLAVTPGVRPPKQSQTWGLNLADGRVRFHHGADVATHLLPQLGAASRAMALRAVGPPLVQLNVVGETVNAVASVAGDVLEAMWHGVEKVTQVIIDTTAKVVNGIAQVIVYIGDQVVSFVIQCIADVLSLISWILQAIAVTLETLIKWLGFIFSWGDILNTHRVISKMVNETIGYFGAELDGAADRVRLYFDQLILRVAALPMLQVPGEQNINLFALNTSAAAQATPQQLALAAQTSNSAGSSFANYQLMHGGILTGTAPADDATSTPIEAFFHDVLAPTLRDFFNTFKNTIDDLLGLIKNNELTINNILKVFSSDFIIGLIEVVRDLIAGLIDALADTIDWVNAILNAKLPIPFLSGLYSLVTKGSTFSLLDCFSLFFAIPATIGYKIIGGKAPFTDEQVTWLESQTYATLFPASLLPPMAGPHNKRLALVTTDEVWTGIKAAYSLIGGMVYSMSDLVGCFVYGAKAATLGEIKMLDKLDTVCGAVYFAFSFPLREDDDVTEQILDLPVWLGEGVGLGLKAIIARTKRLDVEAKEGEATIEDLFTLVEGLWDCAFYIISLGVAEEKDAAEYIKTGQNLCSGLGGAMAGASAFMTTESEVTGQIEITVLGIAGYSIAVLLKDISAVVGGARIAKTMIDDVEEIYYIM